MLFGYRIGNPIASLRTGASRPATMKTHFALSLALLGMAVSIAAAETAVLADMEDLLSSSTTTIDRGVNRDYSSSGYTFTFDGSGAAILNITNQDIADYIAGNSGILTIAAWVKQSPVSDGMIFSTGGQSNGFMWGVDNSHFKFVSKNVEAYTKSDLDIPSSSETWTLVAIGINLANPSENRANRYYLGTASNGYYSQSFRDWNDPNPTSFGIGTGNSDSTRRDDNYNYYGFKGSIANLTVIKSDELLNNTQILSLIGDAPVAIPEPATATLSILALAALAARRRRK